jgi:hypothetical protein
VRPVSGRISEMGEKRRAGGYFFSPINIRGERRKEIAGLGGREWTETGQGVRGRRHGILRVHWHKQGVHSGLSLGTGRAAEMKNWR